MSQPDLFRAYTFSVWLHQCGGWIYNVWRAIRLLYWLERDEREIAWRLANPDPGSTWPHHGLDGTGRYTLADQITGLDLGPISIEELDAAWQPLPEDLHVERLVVDVLSERLC